MTKEEVDDLKMIMNLRRNKIDTSDDNELIVKQLVSNDMLDKLLRDIDQYNSGEWDAETLKNMREKEARGY